MKLLKAFGKAVLIVIAYALALVTLYYFTYAMDVYVIGWFGIPTGEGIGIAIMGVIVMLAFVTAMVYD